MYNSYLKKQSMKVADSFVIKIINLIISKNFFNQLFKYSVVGIFNTIIGLTVIYFCFNILSFNYIFANIIGYACGLVNSFIWNKKWTFKSTKHYSTEIIPFLTVFGVSYLTNLLAVIISVELIGIHPNISQILGIVAYSSTNFLINRYWTFSETN